MKKQYSDEEIKAILSASTTDNDVINQKMQEAYDIVRERATAQKKNEKTFRKVWYGLASTAAVFVLVFAVGATNPVWAANIPIIGSIFQKVQELWNYGEVPKEGVVSLETEEPEYVTESEGEVYLYQATANGVTFSLTEYYATNQAVFLGMRIESEEEFPSFHEIEENNLLIQLFAGADVSFDENRLSSGHGYLEGVQIDEHTYEGVLRMDFKDMEIPETFEMDFHIMDVYIYFANPEKTGLRHETFRADCKIENIPIKLSGDAGRVIEIDEVNGDGVGLASIEISPIELTINPINENSLEELVTFAVVLDAEGRKLEFGDGSGENVFAITGRDISTVTVYVCEWDTYMGIKGLALEEDTSLFQNALEENALYKKVIDTTEE